MRIQRFQKKKKSFDANEVIFGHISDGHEFHFFSYQSGGEEHEVTIPLPVILYSPQRGVTTFYVLKNFIMP
jgi:F-type H+-transporting ATPase subunit a